MNSKQTEADYVPYGPEWEKEMSKFPKLQLIKMLGKAYQEKKELKQSLPSKPVGDVEEMAREYAEGMMGLGKYSDRWLHADKMTYNLIIRSVKYGATTTLKTPHSIDVLQITEGYSKGMAEYFMQHNYRLMYELWEQFINQLKSGYAAAPQKGGLPKLDEPLISQQDLEDYEKMEREEKSPSPSEAGDAPFCQWCGYRKKLKGDGTIEPLCTC